MNHRPRIELVAARSNWNEESVERTEPYITSGRQRHVLKDREVEIAANSCGEDVRTRNAVDLPPPLLTVQDLASLLTTSSSGVYSRVARGQIPGALRIGRSLRFDPRVIARWLSANKASAGGLP